MGTASQEFLNPGFLVPLGYPDLKVESPGLKPEYAVGGWSFLNDAFGMRILSYNKVTQTGGHTVGQLGQRDADVAVAGITSGTTTSFVTSGKTADAHISNLCQVKDKNSSAGAAPEGEVGVVVANTATLVTLDPGRPFSTSLLVNDTLTLHRSFDVIDAAIDATAADARGICFHGIPTIYHWGFYQIYGYYPSAAIATSASTANVDFGAEAVASAGDSAVTLGHQFVWGQMGFAEAGQISLFGWVFVNLLAGFASSNE